MNYPIITIIDNDNGHHFVSLGALLGKSSTIDDMVNSTTQDAPFEIHLNANGAALSALLEHLNGAPLVRPMMALGDLCGLAILIHQYDFKDCPTDYIDEILRRPIDKLPYETLVLVGQWKKMTIGDKWRYLMSCEAPVDYIDEAHMAALWSNFGLMVLEKVTYDHSSRRISWRAIQRAIMYIDQFAIKLAILRPRECHQFAICHPGERPFVTISGAIDLIIADSMVHNPHPNVTLLIASMAYLNLPFEDLDDALACDTWAPLELREARARLHGLKK